MTDSAAAGSQPGPIPPIDHALYRADANHYQVGRGGSPIRCLVIHNTESAANTANAPSGRWLSTDSDPPVSIHHLYGRDGTRYDIVNRQDTAWHAGLASWRTYRSLNPISIGHEFESSANRWTIGNGYTQAQLASAAYTVACEMVSYGLAWDCVISHASIALPAGRRSDPSAFPWDLFRLHVQAWQTFLESVPAAEQARYFI